MDNIKKRFFDKVKKDPITGCWEWLAAKNKYGYGVINILGKMVLAHRLSHTLFTGIIPTGMNVCHKCDNPGCVNPEHFFVGTQRDNMKDALRKGRVHINFKPGCPNTTRLLTDDQVREVRKFIAKGDLTQKQIGKLFSISESSINSINTGYRYSDVI